MKRTIKLSLAALLLLAGNATADTKLTDKSVLSGDVRALYYAEDEGSGSESGLGIGINPTITWDCLFSDRLKWELGAGAAIPVSESTEDVSAGYSMAKAPETEGDGSAGYAALTKLNGTYDYGSGFVKIGYQTLETPMADSDDIRLVPNSYFAGIFAYTGLPNTTLLAAQVSHMAGVVDSGSSEGPENYHSMSDAALGGLLADAGLGDNGDIDDKAVNALAAIYGDEEAGVNGQLWYYTMAEPVDGVGAVSALYADAGMTVGTVTVTVQYMTFANDIWSNSAAGLMAETSAGDFGFVAAFNSYGVTVDDQATATALGLGTAPAPAWYAWGGYPEFVSGEEVDASYGDWDGGTAVKAGVSYGGIEALGLNAAYVVYSDTVVAVDVTAEYAFSEALSATAIYETKTYEDDYKSANDVDDTTTVEFKAFYRF